MNPQKGIPAESGFDVSVSVAESSEHVQHLFRRIQAPVDAAARTPIHVALEFGEPKFD